MAGPGLQVFVSDDRAESAVPPVDVARWKALALAVLREQDVDRNGELSVTFVDETAMAALNSEHMDEDGPTDVLSFPIDADAPSGGPVMPMSLLGDVVICPAVAQRNAPEHAGTYEDEIALLLVHGILHVVGMDHAEDDEAAVMQAREQDLLARHNKSAT